MIELFIHWHHVLSLNNGLGFVPKSLAHSLKLYVYLKSQQSFHLQWEIIQAATPSYHMSISHAKKINALILDLSLKYLKIVIWKKILLVYHAITYNLPSVDSEIFSTGLQLTMQEEGKKCYKRISQNIK